MNNNLELKIYEGLGVRKFRNLLLKIYYICIIPFSLGMSREERIKYMDVPNNYFMKKGNGVQDLKDFKKMLLLNSSIHIISFICCSNSLINKIIGSFSLPGCLFTSSLILLNVYCLMLQRYNQIRINNTIKRYSKIEDKYKENIRSEILNNKEIINSYNYKIVNNKNINNNKELSIDELINSSTIEQLRNYKVFFETIKKYNDSYGSDKYIDSFKEATFPIDKRKVLKMEYKGK